MKEKSQCWVFSKSYWPVLECPALVRAGPLACNLTPGHMGGMWLWKACGAAGCSVLQAGSWWSNAVKAPVSDRKTPGQLHSRKAGEPQCPSSVTDASTCEEQGPQERTVEGDDMASKVRGNKQPKQQSHVRWHRPRGGWQLLCESDVREAGEDSRVLLLWWPENATGASVPLTLSALDLIIWITCSTLRRSAWQQWMVMATEIPGGKAPGGMGSEWVQGAPDLPRLQLGFWLRFLRQVKLVERGCESGAKNSKSDGEQQSVASILELK